ncbi:MAG: protein translocase subunit SecF [Chromatiaceae bacterium]|nr:protein translocase subunit SecF [Chromatiaceae bacterium]MCP5312831.1 protein translocase subunit SecF [Chromatiaceae bacterium]
MELFKANSRIDFMGWRRVMAVVLALLIATSIASLAFRGLVLGLDLTGGVLMELGYAAPVDLGEVRASLVKAGYGEAVVQSYGSARDVMVRLAPRAGEDNEVLSAKVLDALRGQRRDEVSVRRVEFVGAQVGEELTEQGALAVLVALFGILIYVAMRFEWRFALGAVLATVHDTIFTLGFFSLFRVEFDLTVLAAVLAVIGYSLNDTIVVFDRIRENFRRMRTGRVADVMNAAINQTLSRTIMTSFTTLLVVIALYVVGGAVVHGFSLALIVGIVVGTVSSIYVASPLALWLGVSRADLIQEKRPAGESDGRP